MSIFAAGGAAGADGRYINTGILSTWPHSSAGDYAWMAGTSMAAPHVAAALALLMSTGLSNAGASSRLLQTADSQRRMHVDAALDSTAPCGRTAGAAPPRTVSAPPVVVRPAVVPRVAPAAAVPSASASSAAAVGPSVRATVARVVTPSTGGAMRPASVRGLSPWVGRLALAVAGCLLALLTRPRRLLLRVRRA